MEEVAQNTGGGYNKRPLWQWLAIYFVLGLIIYGAVYYFFLRKNTNYTAESPDQYTAPTSAMSPSPSAMGGEAVINLDGVNNSNQTGTAKLTEENGQTKVEISLTGFTKDIEQPAHIHLGECPGVGSVKYPLTSIVNGASVTTLAVTLEQLKKELPLAINVHKSAAEVSVYTACGPLEIK